LSAPGAGRHNRVRTIRLAEYERALHSDQLTLHYQPIVTIANGRTRGVEALLRWPHPRDGMLLPDRFLPAVIHTPVMRDTTRWVLRRACAEARRWDGWTVSVNVSARDVTQPALADDVEEALSSSQLPGPQLTLELTEHALVSDMPAAVDVLRRIRSLGVGASLDDFGTGYSSLLYLRELPLTELKIDRTFVSGVGASSDDQAIVTSVVRLADAIGAHAVAEGVETMEQARYLRSIGCLAGQGYLWGRPVESDQLTAPQTGAVAPVPAPSSPRRAPREVHPEVTVRIRHLLDAGASPHTIAGALNRTGLRTGKGARWTAATVATVIADLPPA
jgi:EAL domain-containing protein (putative c-di-GMP-specific phosphodiesterase class I)